VKPALLIQVFWPAIRLLVQNIGVAAGGKNGIIIMQCSQIITIIGGPNGYVLALNSFVTEVSTHEQRTGALGRLQGCMMVGAALGFLIGGLIGERSVVLGPRVDPGRTYLMREVGSRKQDLGECSIRTHSRPVPCSGSQTAAILSKLVSGVRFSARVFASA
jgi:hypothetical protein